MQSGKAGVAFSFYKMKKMACCGCQESGSWSRLVVLIVWKTKNYFDLWTAPPQQFFCYLLLQETEEAVEWAPEMTRVQMSQEEGGAQGWEKAVPSFLAVLCPSFLANDLN